MAPCAGIAYYCSMPDKKRTVRLDWEDVRYFVALARQGTLSATAPALRVNHATVARRIASLETPLGRTLFDRRAKGYVLMGEDGAQTTNLGSGVRISSGAPLRYKTGHSKT